MNTKLQSNSSSFLTANFTEYIESKLLDHLCPTNFLTTTGSPIPPCASAYLIYFTCCRVIMCDNVILID